MSRSITDTLQSFVDLDEKEFHRFNSWGTCFDFFHNKYFIDQGDEDTAALHLGFYLASWGMYRGSTFLLQNDYTLHIGVVKILKKYYSDGIDINYDTMKKISDEITAYYEKHAHTNGKKNNTASSTLITKILLGTLGCIPAYDRFFVNGLAIQNKNDKNSKLEKRFNDKSLKALERFYETHKEEFKTFEDKYPKMKLLDMYFWKLGFDNG